MPLSEYPQRWQTSIRAARFLFYASAAAVGASGLFLTPETLIAAAGEPLTAFWSGLMLAGGMVGMLGVAQNRYRIEWLATWPLSGGSLAYAATVWMLVAAGSHTRATQAFALTALGLALACHGLTLAAHAAKLRLKHELEHTSVQAVQEARRD